MTMQIVFGSRLSPLGGPHEAKRGRLAIYQEYIPGLDTIPPGFQIESWLFGPDEVLAQLAATLRLEYGNQSTAPYLVYPGETGPLLELVKQQIPDLDVLNCDDDADFARLKEDVTAT